MLTAAVERLARLYPRQVTPGDDLARSLAFLSVDLRPATVVRAGYGAALAVATVGVPVVALAPPGPRPVAGLVVLALALLAAHVVHGAPRWLASMRRSRALGDAPDLVGRAVLRMHVAPAPEAAAAFAARTGDGPLAESLGAHVRDAGRSPDAGLRAFASEWGEWFPSLRRALHLLDAAAAEPDGRRGRTLDRAMDAVLAGARDRMASFAADVRAPATALYAFGVLLPLALVAVLPAAGVAGVPVTAGAVVLVYDAFLPAVLVVAGGWLLARRPVAFPPPRVDRSHPDVARPRWVPVAAGAGTGLAAAATAGVLLPPWSVPLAAVGATAGVTLLAWFRPVARVRRRVRRVEAHLSDALYLVGRRVAEGTAVERAVEQSAPEVPGATGETLAAAARRQRQLRVGVREAFLGRHGVLADVPSPRARGAAALLGLAASEGRPAGRAVVAVADHLADLRAVERSARDELARVTGTLRSTAAVFGPLVAGATVALADGVADLGGGTGVGTGAGSGVAPGTLGLAVGAYVLVLAALLTALAVGLERGLDRALVGYRVGRAVCAAVVVYLGTVLVVGTLV